MIFQKMLIFAIILRNMSEAHTPSPEVPSHEHGAEHAPNSEKGVLKNIGSHLYSNRQNYYKLLGAGAGYALLGGGPIGAALGAGAVATFQHFTEEGTTTSHSHGGGHH